MSVLIILLLTAALLLAERGLYRRQWDKKLHYECTFSTDEAYEGDEIELVETVSNGKALPLAWAKAEIAASQWLRFAGSQSIVAGATRYVPSFFVLRGRHRVVRRWKVRCDRRGVYVIDKTVLVTTDLLGLDTFSLPVRLNARLTVLPRPQAPEDVLLTPSGLTGDILVRRRLLTDPFSVSSVRAYLPGDPANRIHWPATAKSDQIMIRNQDATSDQSVTILLNMQTRTDEGAALTDAEDIEQGIRAAATAIAETAGCGIPARLIANGGGADGTPTATGSGAGDAFAIDLLRVLAQLAVRKSENFASYTDRLRSAVGSTDLIVISPYLDDAIARFAQAQQQCGVQVRLLLTRAADADTLRDDIPTTFFLPCAETEATA